VYGGEERLKRTMTGWKQITSTTHDNPTQLVFPGPEWGQSIQWSKFFVSDNGNAGERGELFILLMGRLAALLIDELQIMCRD
jgi:hypothetical protein